MLHLVGLSTHWNMMQGSYNVKFVLLVKKFGKPSISSKIRHIISSCAVVCCVVHIIVIRCLRCTMLYARQVTEYSVHFLHKKIISEFSLKLRANSLKSCCVLIVLFEWLVMIPCEYSYWNRVVFDWCVSLFIMH